MHAEVIRRKVTVSDDAKVLGSGFEREGVWVLGVLHRFLSRWGMADL